MTMVQSVDGCESSSTAYSNTIWPSVPSSSQVSRSHTFNSGVVSTSATPCEPPSSSSSYLTLSLDPSMIDSAVLSNFHDDASHDNLNTEENRYSELDTLSFYSGVSNSSISSCSVASIPDHDPHLFTNIGRALLQLSANENTSASGHSSVPGNGISTCSPSRDGHSNKNEWWTRFRTEEDWESFTEIARQYLSTLVSAELMEMEKDMIERDRDPWRTKSEQELAVQPYGLQKNSYSIAKIWLHKIYRAIAGLLGANTRDLINDKTQMRMNYISYLVKELAFVEQKLNNLPPVPPMIVPSGLPENADIFLTLQWRAENTKERELLELKQSTCREEILSAIIETEEDLFWSKEDSNKFGSVDNDGYVQIVKSDSHLWGDVEDAEYIPRERSNIGLQYLIAVTAGAAGIASFFLRSRKI